MVSSNDSDITTSVAADNSGNVYVTGWCKNRPAFGTENYCTIKYNSNGVQQWVVKYNGNRGLQ
ncbi:MAG: SBBP repeat-containing protein [Ignavibacteria bacterium]